MKRADEVEKGIKKKEGEQGEKVEGMVKEKGE